MAKLACIHPDDVQHYQLSNCGATDLEKMHTMVEDISKLIIEEECQLSRDDFTREGTTVEQIDAFGGNCFQINDWLALL
jgi:hypothetical protein